MIKFRKHFHLLFFLFSLCLFTNCVNEGNSEDITENNPTSQSKGIEKSIKSLDFEGFSKTGYQKGILSFEEYGEWILNNAMIGASEKDNGEGKSVRIKENGSISSQHTYTGKKIIIIYETGNFGTDKSGEIELRTSTDAIHWIKWQVNPIVEQLSNNRSKYQFNIDELNSQYIQFYNASTGSKSRINLDNIQLINAEINHNSAKENDAVKAETSSENSGGTSEENTTVPTEEIISSNSNEDLLKLPGNVSEAGKSSKDNYLIKKKTILISYNNRKKIPNWVSWHLTSTDIGSLGRSDFKASTYLSNDFNYIDKESYSGTGFDRGHLCPSKDRTSSVEHNQEVFEMDNMCPQIHELNSGPWEKLERYCRTITEKGKELYIITGPYGEGGINKFGESLIMTKKGITVPSHFWKIILILKKGENDLNRVQKNATIFAVMMPNTPSADGKDFRDYITSVDAIEKKTGYDFFKILNDAIENEIEAKIIPLKVIDDEIKW